jgi:hypothetical protein
MTAGSTAMLKIGGALIAGLMLVTPRIAHPLRADHRNLAGFHDNRAKFDAIVGSFGAVKIRARP